MADHGGEGRTIARTSTPLTQSTLRAGLVQIGLRPGDVVILHVSLARLGWICGGEQALLQAVLDCIGPDGTVAMPGFSSQLSDPASWSDPPVPADWITPIRDNMPIYDRDKTPTRGLGRTPEAFRKWPGTKRSDHPRDSFLANGPLANQILSAHDLTDNLGPGSPLGRLHDLGAKILLLGAGYGSCTSFHLAEHHLPGVSKIATSYPVRRENGATIWQDGWEYPTFEQHFPSIGEELDTIPGIVTFGFGGTARCFPMAKAVETARKLLENANLSGGGDNKKISDM